MRKFIPLFSCLVFVVPAAHFSCNQRNDEYTRSWFICFLLQLPETTDAADSVLPGVQIKKIGLKLAGTTDISGAIIAAGDHRRKCSILI